MKAREGLLSRIAFFLDRIVIPFAAPLAGVPQSQVGGFLDKTSSFFSSLIVLFDLLVQLNLAAGRPDTCLQFFERVRWQPTLDRFFPTF